MTPVCGSFHVFYVYLPTLDDMNIEYYVVLQLLLALYSHGRCVTNLLYLVLFLMAMF